MGYRRARRGFSAALAAFCMTVATVAGAADTIRELAIRNRGAVPVENTYLLSHVTSKVGDALSPETVSRDVRALLDTRQYAYVTTKIEPVDSGVRLVFVVESRYRLGDPVQVEGNKKLSRSKVRELLGLEAGCFVDDEIVASAVAKVRTEYRRRRYTDVTVAGAVTPVPGSPGSATVLVTVVEGQRYRIPLIEFEGNKVVTDAHLRRFSGQSPWWNPSGWFSTKRLEDYDLELLRSDARRQYADLGYLDADVSPARITVKDGEQQISFTVEEGIRYTVSRVVFEGVTLFPEDTLRTASKLRPGVIASRASIEAGAKAVRDYFGARGYVGTVVKPGIAPVDAQPQSVIVTYRVAEGELAYVRSILIRGNTRTKDKVIRREISLSPGEILNEVQAERSTRRLTNLGYFESVRQYDVETPDGVRRDLVYEVEEKPTGQFLIGAGFSSVDHLIGFTELSQSNFDLFNWGHFTGGGQKARIGMELSQNASNVEVSFVEPWFLDRRLALNVDAFMRNRSYSEYDESRLGGSVGLSKHIPWVGRLGLAYTLQRVSMDDVIEGDFRRIDEPHTIYRYTDEDDGYTQGSLKLNWTYDTRDSPMVPKRGTRATAALTEYGPAFGGDVEMYELSARARHYIPTFYGHVISFFARTDVIEATGDEEVPIGNRYFLGGGRNVRGFKYRSIGPKVQSVDAAPDSKEYRPIGGQSLLQGSVEYTIPITSFFRLAAFYDIGNVWADPYEFDLNEYASSVGGGLRLDFPGFPMRLDYSHPLERDDDYSRTEFWVFWVGFD